MSRPLFSPTTTGVLLMAAAMLIIPTVDGFAKALSASYSPLFISWMRYAAACLIALPLGVLRNREAMFPRTQRGAHLLRTCLMVTTMTLYFLALSYTTMANAITASFVGPVVATGLAIVLLGEPLTVRKTISLALGLGGALFIARPSGGELNTGVMLAFGAGIVFALYLIATRHARNADPFQTLAFQCVVGSMLLLPQAIYSWQTPAASDLWLFAGLGVCSVVSHLLSITAFRYAQASTLAPLVYLELLGNIVIGYFIFSEWPSATVWIGAAAIVCAGAILIKGR